MRFTNLLALLPALPLAFAATGYIHSEPLLPRGFSSLSKRFDSTNPQVTTEGSVCTVKPLGGGLDDGPNLLYAFNLCSPYALINLPGYYQVNTVLNTSLHNVEIRLSGAISYVPDIAYWSPNSIYLTYQNATTYWFFSGEGVTFHGGGTIDANGLTWWQYFASGGGSGVAGGSSRVFARPIPLTVGNASDIVIEDLSIINAPFWNNFVYQSTNVLYDNIKIRAISPNASAPAKNSDGWDIYRSDHVTIRNSNVVNGDDCVSFKPNSTYMTVENMVCNGSHGISVGSLGQYYGQTDIVANVYVRNISMSNAENGARIKVFGGSNDTNSVSGGGSGYVNNITFEDFRNINVDNPIYLTQCYSTPTAQCLAHPATLQISNVRYINVTGTTSGLVSNHTLATLECSAQCTNITATGTDLAYPLVPTNGTELGFGGTGGFGGTEPNGTAVATGTAGGRYLCANIVDESLLDFECTNVNITKG